MNSRRERTWLVHGFAEDADSVASDYECPSDQSHDAHRPIAEEILRSFNGCGTRATEARTRIEALTSYMRNAIMILCDFDDERSQLHRKASNRFGRRLRLEIGPSQFAHPVRGPGRPTPSRTPLRVVCRERPD